MPPRKTLAEYRRNATDPEFTRDADEDGEETVDQSAAQLEPDEPPLRFAPELEQVAEELIGERRPILRDCRILYAFTTIEHKRGGRPVLADVHKLSTVEQFLQAADLADPADFLVTFDRRRWLAQTSTHWREAAMFDALCRIGTKADTQGNETWVLRSPTVQTFPEVLSAFGAWDEALAEAVEVIRQLPLPEPAGVPA